MSSWIEPRVRLGTLAAALCAALLSGCVVGPNYQAPAPATGARYTATTLTELTAADAPHPVSALPMPVHWWTLLQSAPLDSTIRAALAGNRSLAATRERLAQEEQLVRASEAALYPNVGLAATAGRVKYGPAFLGPEKLPPFSYFSVGPTVSYAFDYLGGVRRGVEQQRALQTAQAQQLQAAALALSGNVAMQALLVASAHAQLDALTAVVGDDRRNLQLVQTAFEAGGATRVDILNAQSQLANDQTLLAPLRQQLSVAQDALALLVGQPPGNWSAPDFRLADFRLPAELPLTLPSELAHQRPDILAAEARLHAATAAVGVATASLYPQLSLSANASFQSNVIQQLFNVGGIGAGVSAALAEPLFDHGELRARRQAAIDEMRAALDDYQQALLSAFGQVADSLQGLDHDQELLISERTALQTASQNLELTRESYAAGNSGVLQILDAQRLDEQARLGLVRVQAQQLQDAVQLLLALGGRAPLLSSAEAATQGRLGAAQPLSAQAAMH